MRYIYIYISIPLFLGNYHVEAWPCHNCSNVGPATFYLILIMQILSAPCLPQQRDPTLPRTGVLGESTCRTLEKLGNVSIGSKLANAALTANYA